MSEGKTDLRWLRQWAPTFAVLVPLTAATYYFETLFGEVGAELRENRAAGSRLQDSVANVYERVSALEARQG